jgi:mRNA interferase RelE/StbE
LAWRIEYTDTAKSQLGKLDPQVARRIIDYMDQRIAPLEDAHTAGKVLTGPLSSLWRYRVGDYRIICEIRNAELVVLAVTIGHRRDVYE